MTISPRTQILEHLDSPKREGTALEDIRAGDLSAAQLLHLASCKRAVELAGPPPPLRHEQWLALTIEDRLYRTAEDFRRWGAPEGEIGLDLAWKLIKLGYSTDDAEETLRGVGVTWCTSGASAA